MAGNYELQLSEMLEPVARALGSELLSSMAFVGGSTTGILITDAFSRESVRYTDDVDVIVGVNGWGQWAHLLEELGKRGFHPSMEEEVICRLRLNTGEKSLAVDVMPDDEDILKFSNRWYRDALRNAQPFTLAPDLIIRVLTPPYFVATKLEAWLGRGNNDPMNSHDIEDLINIIDGREELLGEIAQAEAGLRTYIAQQFTALLQHRDFEYAVQGNVRDTGRAEIIFERLEQLTAVNS